MQLNFGDYLSIFNGRDLQSQQIQKLGKDFNKKLQTLMAGSINYRKTISSPGKYMLVQFSTDALSTYEGFRANIFHIPIESNCANWLNKTVQFLKSPDYPTINCNWVVTAPLIDSTIAIHFETFEVNVFSLYIVSFHFLAEGGILL